MEDASWLKGKHDSSHINLGELDAVLKGINLASKWAVKELTLATDSATVFGWLRSIVHGTHNVRTKALSELLIRRRLDILREAIVQEGLIVKPMLVRSRDNKADVLSRIPAQWARRINMHRDEDAPAAAAGHVVPPIDEAQVIRDIHDRHHFGVERTLGLVREALGEAVTKDAVKKVVGNCVRCARYCPAVTHRWRRGTLHVSEVWSQLAVDVTHVSTQVYLSVVYVASRFAVWYRLANESAHEVASSLRHLFAVMGPPDSIFSDNGTVFRSMQVANLLSEWDVQHDFSCAYQPQGNGV